MTRYRRVIDRRLPCTCACGANAVLGVYTAPMAHVQEEAHYMCPATGEPVTSWRQRKNIFAKHGLMDANEVDQDYLKRERLKKKQERDAISKDYLPQDLKNQIQELGKQQNFVG